MCVCVWVCTYGDQKLVLRILIVSALFFLRVYLSLNLEVAFLAKLDIHQAPGLQLPLPPSRYSCALVHLALYVGTGVLTQSSCPIPLFKLVNGRV